MGKSTHNPIKGLIHLDEYMTKSTTVKPVYNGPVYSGHPGYCGHWTTSQNFQLPYILCKVDLYTADTLYITRYGHLAVTQGWLLYTGLTV